MSSVARITEISAESNQSFEDAIRTGVERANKTLRGVRARGLRSSRSRWITDASRPSGSTCS